MLNNLKKWVQTAVDDMLDETGERPTVTSSSVVVIGNNNNNDISGSSGSIGVLSSSVPSHAMNNNQIGNHINHHNKKNNYSANGLVSRNHLSATPPIIHRNASTSGVPTPVIRDNNNATLTSTAASNRSKSVASLRVTYQDQINGENLNHLSLNNHDDYEDDENEAFSQPHIKLRTTKTTTTTTMMSGKLNNNNLPGNTRGTITTTTLSLEGNCLESSDNTTTTTTNKNNRSSSMTNEHLLRTTAASVAMPNAATTSTTSNTSTNYKPKISTNYLSVDLDSNSNSSQSASQRKSSLQIVPNSNNTKSNNANTINSSRRGLMDSNLTKLIKNESDEMTNDSIDFNDNSSLVEIVIDGLNDTTTTPAATTTLKKNHARSSEITNTQGDIFRERKKSVDERRLHKSVYDQDTNSQNGSCKSIESAFLDAKPKPKRKLPSTPSGLNQDPSSALISPYSSHFSIPSNNNGLSHSLAVPNPSAMSNSSTTHRPKLVENVTEWLNKSFDQSKIAAACHNNGGGGVGNEVNMAGCEQSSYKSAQHLLNIDSYIGVAGAGQKQHRSYSVAVPIPATTSVSGDEPLIEINMNKHFWPSQPQQQQNHQQKDDSMDDGSPNQTSPPPVQQQQQQHQYQQPSLPPSPHERTNIGPTTRSEANLVESAAARINQKRIFIYTDPKELVVSSPVKDNQQPSSMMGTSTGTGCGNNNSNSNNNNSNNGGSSTTSNSRRSSLSLGMEIVGAQVTGAPAIVSSIPSDGLIKQFGVDIGEGDEILSVNGHYLRNRSDVEIDRIIGESALESQGELELLVVKQRSHSHSHSHHHHNNQGNMSPGDMMEDHRAMMMNEETSSSEAQLNDSSLLPRDRGGSVTKSRVVSSSSSSLASNSSSSTTNGPRQMRTTANTHQTPELMLNNIDENEPEFNCPRRKSITYVGKPINPISYGEGRGFNEISIKRSQQTSPKRDFMMTDPAHLLRQRSQMSPARKTPSSTFTTTTNIDITPQYLATTNVITPPTSPKALYSSNGQYEQATMRVVENHNNNNNKTSQSSSQQPVYSSSSSSSASSAASSSLQQQQQQQSHDLPTPTTMLDTSFVSSQPSRQQPQQQPRQQLTRFNLSENDSDSLFSNRSSSLRSPTNGATKITSSINSSMTVNDLDSSSLLSANTTDTSTSMLNQVGQQPLQLPPPPTAGVRKSSGAAVNGGVVGTPFGELQIQMKHDNDEQQIVVTIVRARNLIARDANGFSDPYVKCYLLPGRDQENKRRTKHVLKSLNPEWNCTVVYPNVHQEELKYKTLEFTVWDWDRFKSNDFLGMVKVELKDGACLDNKPRWYTLENNAYIKELESSFEAPTSKQRTANARSFKAKKSPR